MRKAALLGAVAAVAFGMNTAKADVFVLGNVYKLVTIDINEFVDIDKNVQIKVNIRTQATQGAETESVFNQSNNNNHACENCAEKTDLIIGSILRNSGITSVNQSSGNMNNQGTIISVAFFDASNKFTYPVSAGDPTPNDRVSYADAQVVGEQKIHDNTIYSVAILFRDALIRGSINNNSGITAVNQAVGNIANQSNAISIAITKGIGVALSDVALGQFNGRNNVTEDTVFKTAVIARSVNANQGITQVNQTAGVNANQSNVVSVATAGIQ